MNSFLRPLSRSAPLRNAPLALRPPSRFQNAPRSTARLVAINLPQVYVRFAASSVSGRPGSQTLDHAKLNVKEEVGNSLTDWARSIAGGVFTVDSVKPVKDSFVSGLYPTCE
jgi:hypothetical protein